jgi:hypothetical protein
MGSLFVLGAACFDRFFREFIGVCASLVMGNVPFLDQLTANLELATLKAGEREANLNWEAEPTEQVKA